MIALFHILYPHKPLNLYFSLTEVTQEGVANTFASNKTSYSVKV